MWLVLIVGLTGLFLLICYAKTPQLAMGIVIPLAFVMPSWLILRLLDSPNGTVVASGIDIKFAVGTCCLVAYCVMPGRWFPWKLVPSDLAMLALVAVHLASDLFHGSPWWKVLAHGYAEWWVPYVAGRLAIRSAADLRWFPYVVAAIAVLVGIIAVIEGVARINLFEMLAGERPTEGFSRNAERWRMKRAFGSTFHPIYFGVLQLYLLGFTAFATLQCFKRKAHPAWMFCLLPIALGIICTGSRGPILGIFLTAICFVFVRFRQARLPISVSSAVLLLLLIWQQEAIINKLESWSGGSRARADLIEVDGTSIEHSGTRNRLNILEVYRIALRRSGLIGFGTDAVSGFPINVPVGPREVATLKKTKYIDNTYVLFTLRFGYVGITIFLAACLIVFGQFVYLADKYRGTTLQAFASCLAAVLLANLFVLFTVWMPYEIGFPTIWFFGISSGLMHVHQYCKPRQLLLSSEELAV